MKHYIKWTLLGCSAILMSTSLLTGCNTAKGLVVGADNAVVGTAQGAEKDVNAVEKSMAPSKAKAKANKKMQKKHKASN
jgi:predicted small secreted protein